jgi:predicted ArsR family transcriptional regulator
MTDDFARRVSGVAALAEEVRRDLYLYVVAEPEPVSRDQAAAGVGVPRHTAKFHLDRLVEEGLLETEFRRLSGRQGPGAGRPAKLYRRSPGEVAVSLPERHYDLAGRLLAGAIEDSSRHGTPVAAALQSGAQSFGAGLGAEARARAGEPVTAATAQSAARDVLAEHGYEPRVVDGSITLQNCPFHRLAQEHTDLVCGMNLDLVGALAASLDDHLAARLDPADGRCCVVLDPA